MLLNDFAQVSVEVLVEVVELVDVLVVVEVSVRVVVEVVVLVSVLVEVVVVVDLGGVVMKLGRKRETEPIKTKASCMEALSALNLKSITFSKRSLRSYQGLLASLLGARTLVGAPGLTTRSNVCY